MNFKLLNKEDTYDLLKKVERPENFGLYKDLNIFNKSMYLMNWYNSHKNLDNSTKRIRKINKLLGKYSIYSKKYKDIAFSVKNAIWAFSYKDFSFILYYSELGMTIEINENSVNYFEEIINFLIFKLCICENMPEYTKQMLQNKKID